MRTLPFWMGLILISVVPLYLTYIYEPPNILTGLFILVVAVIFFSFSPYDFDIERKSSLALLIAFLPLSLLLKFPFNVGFILLSIAMVFCISANRFKRTRMYKRIVRGIFFGGLTYTVVYSFYPLYVILFSRYHRVDLLSPILSNLLAIFGVRSSVNNGLVYIQTYYQTFPLTVTWEKLCILVWINLLLLFLLFSFLYSDKKIFCRNLVVFVVVGWIYLVVRLAFTVILYCNNLDLRTFWNTSLIVVSFIPLSFLLAPVVKFNESRLVLNSKGRKDVIPIILFFIFIFLLVGAFVFEDPGARKSGKILIDEYHSDWEDTIRGMDKEWYGELSTYNYYWWARWLDIYYDVDMNTDQELTFDLLKNYDILILKCPTAPYSPAEIEDILRFVEDGGGLYLIGDHTDVFGMNTYLNQVSKHFGIIFKTDATYELTTGSVSKYEPPFLFAHPIVKTLDRFEFLTSCSLDVPINCENVIIGYGLLGEPGTYSTSVFFREPFSAPDVEYGFLVQAAALHYGKGRVVAFTDSTCFSSFCIFMDGYKNFNLGTIEYLNRMNVYDCLNIVFGIISIISFILFLILSPKEDRGRVQFVVLFSASISFLLSAPVFDYINASNYQLPSDELEHPKACFDMEHSSIEISPVTGPRPYGVKDPYNTFFVWTERVGWIPSIERDLQSCIRKGDAIVIINPDKEFKDGEIEGLKEFVKNGGKLLVMDSIRNKLSTANQILNNFGMEITIKSMNLSVKNDTILIGNITCPYLTVKGGDTNFSFENNSFLSVKRFGKGKVVVFVDSYTFSNGVMGGVFTEPSKKQRSVYDVEFFIFEKLFSD